MPTTTRNPCPACGASGAVTVDGRCVVCGADLGGAAARAVAQADAALALLRGHYDAIAAQWSQWAAYREHYVAQVRRSVPVPTPQPANAQPSPVEAQATQGASERPAPRPRQRRASAAREALTAPALLGVAGASLLVAAAIVFVALAWTSFSSVARGTVVLAVGCVVAGISVWVRRLGLAASSGAIGTVAIGFAGVSAIAYFRDSGAIGSFDAPAALMIASLAGLVLSRFGVPWVGSAAALAMAGSVVSFTAAATTTAGRGASQGATVSAMPAWILAGTGAATALAASHSLWRWTVAKTVVAWASVVWLGVVGASVPAWVWFGDGGALDAALGFAPVVALAALATRWQVLATGPAAFLLSLVAPALAAGIGAGFWVQAAVSAATVCCVIACGSWLPRPVLRPLFIGVAPAYAVVAAASASYALSITVGRVLAGTYVPDTHLWAGVAALLCGLAIAALRPLRLAWTALRIATSVGAVMVAVGSGIMAFGVAELTGPRLYHSSVAIALAVVAVGLAAMVRVWWEREARTLTEAGVLAFLVTAAVHADWALGISESPVALGIAVAAAPLAVFAARARSAPWWTLPFLTAGVTAVAPAVAVRYQAPTALLAAVLVCSACVVAWTAWRLPRAAHPQVAVGLAPALGVGLACAAGSAAATVATVVTSEVDGARSPWWDVASLGLALCLAAWHRWRLPASAVRALPLIGAITLIIAGAGFVGTAAAHWGRGLEGAVPLWVLVAAAALLPGIVLWHDRTAAWVNGIGSAGLAVLAGLNALGYVAVAGNSLWLPLGVAVAAIAVLGVGSARWPSVTLPPAVLLATGLGLVLPLRTDAAVMVALTLAAAVGAAAVWIPLAGSRRVFAAAGAVPALGLGVFVSAVGALAAVLELPYHTREQTGPFLGGFTLAAQAAVAVAALALPRIARAWDSQGRVALGDPVPLARWTLLSTALAAMASVTMVAHDLSVTSPSVAAVMRQAVAGVAAVTVAVVYTAARSRVFAVRSTRRAARVGAVSWVALCAVDSAWDASGGYVAWQAGAAALVLAGAVLAAVARRWRRTAVPGLVVVLTAVPLVLSAAGVVSATWQAPTVAAAAAACAWLARVPALLRVAPAHAIRLGLIPAALATAPAALFGAGRGVEELWRHLVVGGSTSFGAWSGVTLMLVVLGLLSMRPVRRVGTPVVAVAMALGLAWAAPAAAVAVLIALELLALAAHRRLALSAKGAAVAGVGALCWSSHDWRAVTLAASALTAVAVVVVLRRASRPPVLAVLAGPLGAALAAAAASYAVGGTVGGWLAAPAGAVALSAAGAVIWTASPRSAPTPLTWVLGVATVAAPLLAHSFTAAGTTLLVLALAWLACGTRGLAGASWYASVAASVGVGLIAWGAGVGAIEAYTLAPAACAVALAVHRMRSAPDVSSLAAWAPGLCLALVPSYLALLANPDSLARTAWLTVLMVALALVGISRRWFAPVAATAVTAVLVAALQIVVGSNLVFRLFAFLVVGTLLLVAASWFDKIKALR